MRLRIEALQGEMQAQEASRRESRDALRATESAISDVNRTLRELDARSRETQSRLQTIGERRRFLEGEIARQQGALGRVLAATYAGGDPGPLRLALSGDDPNEAARKLYYLALVSRAAARLAAAHRADLGKLESVKRSALEQNAQVEAIERERRTERERILTERRERQRVLERLAGELRKTRRQVRVLQADESRLARVVEEIGKVLMARPGAGHAPRTVDRLPDSASAAGPFSRLRGRLRLPVRGELIGSFGAQARGSVGGRKGIFIRSAEGEAVRAVAAGRVVYADWMRGFGNLLIVDHGEAYLSIYGNNESLLKRPGDVVAAGETLATVGATGGNEQTGLYFELRHLGKAFDPLRWVSR